MSDFETLLTAWLNGGEIPADFKPTSNVEEYLLAILNGVDDDVDPKSRADVLLDAIATKYAGYADGIANLEDELGVTAIPPTPQQLATLQAQVNEWHLQSLADKGITPEEDNTFQILAAYEQNWPSGGAELNIAFNSTTAPEDTSKLWVKADNPPYVTVDYNPDNTVETVSALSTVLPTAISGIAQTGVVGSKIYIFSGDLGHVQLFDAIANTTIALATSFTRVRASCGVVGNNCYVFGGAELTSSSKTSAIDIYDTEIGTMTRATASLPQAAQSKAAGVVGTKIYLFGGQGNNGYIDTINVFDTETNTISTLSATLPTAARNICCGVVDTKIYLFGGQGNNGYIDTINVFDTETNTISTLSATLPTARGSVSCGVVGTKIYLFGGGTADALLDTIMVFDAATETLTTTTATLPRALAASCVGVVGTDAYLFGGWDGSSFVTDINKFNITFPLAEGAVFVHEDMLRNKFTLVNEPTKVTVGVAAVSRGNASGYAENCEAYLHDGAEWRQI